MSIGAGGDCGGDGDSGSGIGGGDGSCIVEHGLDGRGISGAEEREERRWSSRAADEQLRHAMASDTGVVGAFEHSADTRDERDDVVMGVLPAGVVQEGKFGDHLLDMIVGGGTCCNSSISHS